MTQERTDEDVVRRDFDTVREALTSRFDVRAGMKPPPSIARAFAALDRLLARNEELEENVRVLRGSWYWSYLQGLRADLRAAEERIEELREALRQILLTGSIGGSTRPALKLVHDIARAALTPEEPEGAE